MTHRASLRLTFAAVLTLLFVVARPAAETAIACDCVRLKPLSPAVRTEAALIFEGRVTEIVERNEQTLITRADGGESRSRPLDRQVFFQVTRAWRGVSKERIGISVEISDCMFSFEPGLTYLVFAYLDSRGRPATGICTRTVHIDGARPVLNLLGPPSFTATRKR